MGGENQQSSSSTTISDSYNQTYNSTYNTSLANVGNIALGKDAIAALSQGQTNSFDLASYLPLLIVAAVGLLALRLLK